MDGGACRREQPDLPACFRSRSVPAGRGARLGAQGCLGALGFRVWGLGLGVWGSEMFTYEFRISPGLRGQRCVGFKVGGPENPSAPADRYRVFSNSEDMRI